MLTRSIPGFLLAQVLIICTIVSCSRPASTESFTPLSDDPISSQPPNPTIKSSIASTNTPKLDEKLGQSAPETQIPTISLQATTTVDEYVVSEIKLAGPIAQPQAEISGMAWYDEYLILLPQYPNRFGGNENGAIFAISKGDIKSYISGHISDPLQPIEIPFISSNIDTIVAGVYG